MVAAVPTPIVRYKEGLRGLHSTVATYAPFTYIAYRSLIPSEHEDWIGTAYNITYFITFCYIIDYLASAVSPLCAAIPYIPFALDFFWHGHQCFRGRQIVQVRPEEEAPQPPSTLKRILCIAFLLLGAFGFNVLQRELPGNLRSA